MPALIPYALDFRGGLHVGTRGVNLEETGVMLPADTLFGALLHSWRRAGRDVEALVAPFVAAPPGPPFLLTSAFPYAGDVRFYPMPVDAGRLMAGGIDSVHRGKQLKRIRFLSEGLLLKALGGATLDGDLYPPDDLAEPTTGVALQDGAFWLLDSEADRLPPALQRTRGRRHALRSLKVFATDRTPRVTIDRVRSSSTIFHAGRVTFNQGCGLWFAVQWRTSQAEQGETDYRRALAEGLSILGDDGIGGERNVGYGTFSCQEHAPIVLPDPEPAAPAWLLSRYHPREDELPGALAAPGAAYGLTAVAGWLHSPGHTSQRRKRLMLVSEGSLICPPAYPAGDVQDVRPEYDGAPGVAHPVYRYGLALAVGRLGAKEA